MPKSESFRHLRVLSEQNPAILIINDWIYISRRLFMNILQINSTVWSKFDISLAKNDIKKCDHDF